MKIIEFEEKIKEVINNYYTYSEAKTGKKAAISTYVELSADKKKKIKELLAEDLDFVVVKKI